MKKFKLLIICALISNAYAQEKEKEPDLKTLYGADSTRVTPRNLTNTISQSNPFNPATYQNTGYSIPLKTAYSCQSYRGQYDIDSNAIGTFYIITENNPYLPNYKQIIMTDNSNCYQPCSPTNKNIYKICDTIYGSGYTGMITYNVYSSCTSGGYLQAQQPTYVSDNCVAPPPPTPTPTPVEPAPVVPTPVTPTLTPVDPTPVIPTPTPVEPTPVIPTPTPVEPAPVVPTPTPIGCETIEGYVPLDTVLGPCDIWSRGVSYPRGQTYICKSYGWVQKNLGDRVIKVWCS